MNDIVSGTVTPTDIAGAAQTAIRCVDSDERARCFREAGKFLLVDDLVPATRLAGFRQGFAGSRIQR